MDEYFVNTSSTIVLWSSTHYRTDINNGITIEYDSDDNNSANNINNNTNVHYQNISTINNDINLNNYWALLALILVLGTAAGNILVCLAIAWERRLQNVTNYFLMSLAITDLMVAMLVMPLGILTLVKGYFPLQSEHCLAWICLDVLFCTASIMHLCTISIDRYLSLRYPMKFGRNKTRKRVTVKIIFVWLLSIAMSLPLSLMYSKNHASVLVNGTCQIPDPVYKLVGSIICFYIPLAVMLITYYLTVRLLAQQRQNLGGGGNQSNNSGGGGGWSSGWLGQAPALERRCTWRRLLKTSLPSTPNHAHSATSTDTELSTLDNHELWLPDSSIQEPTPSTMTALHQFGAEMLKLSRGLESVTSTMVPPSGVQSLTNGQQLDANDDHQLQNQFVKINRLSPSPPRSRKVRRSSHTTWSITGSKRCDTPPLNSRKRYNSLPRLVPKNNQDILEHSVNRNCRNGLTKSQNTEKYENECSEKEPFVDLPPPCTCPYFGDTPNHNVLKPAEVRIISTSGSFRSTTTTDSASMSLLTTTTTTTSSSATVSPSKSSLQLLPVPVTPTPPARKLSYTKANSVVTWDTRRNQRRGSSLGGVRTSLLLTPNKVPSPTSPLRRSATLRNHNNMINGDSLITKSGKTPSSPCLLQRTTTIRSHHSRNSSVISRNSSRHGRIIRLEQKATKVLGVVFFTFVILWAPFFVLNLLPSLCRQCEENMSPWVFDVVTWLGYASSMVNPIFYTIFNKVFRQAFKKVLCCQYSKNSKTWRPQR